MVYSGQYADEPAQAEGLDASAESAPMPLPEFLVEGVQFPLLSDVRRDNSIYDVEMNCTPGEWTTASYCITELAQAHFGKDVHSMHAEFVRIGDETPEVHNGTADGLPQSLLTCG